MALTTDLVAYWKLDGNSNDALGSYNGTDTDITYVTGKINNGADFNGSSSKIVTGDIDLTGNYSFSVWVKVENQPALDNSDPIINKYDDLPYTGGYEFKYMNDSGTYKICNTAHNSTPSTKCVNQTLTAGTWYHLVLTHDGTNDRFYVDGSEHASSPVANTDNASANTKNTTIGAFGYSTPMSGDLARYFDGIIDEVGIWSRALTTAEVITLYNNGNGLYYDGVKSRNGLAIASVNKINGLS